MAERRRLDEQERSKRREPEPEPVRDDVPGLAGEIARLQRTAGNAAVARALGSRSPAAIAAEHGIREDAPPRVGNPGPDVRTYRLEAQIRCDPHAGAAASPDATRAVAPAGTLSDAQPGAESHVELGELEPFVTRPPMPAGATPETAGPGAETAEQEGAEGEAPESETAAGPQGAQAAGTVEEVHLPDIVIPALAELDITDSVSSWLSYAGTITRGGIAPSGSEFGVTGFGDVRVTGISVRRIGFLGVFVVTATIEHRIKWETRRGTGPGGEVSVDSFMDADLTAANYAAAANDLTPNMSDLNGRPPRTAFWAQDLTERHEQFHADDAKSNGPAAVRAASAWLSAQTATDVPGVHALLASVPGRVVTSLVAAMAFPAVEERAYGDGAGAYGRRASAIRTAGSIGLYP
ncbi:MAG TPA: hypothetical protein VNS09_21795 [Solirubrobacter sp.]|nr:hypothetical protein [Solirubrobacter sp.]